LKIICNVFLFLKGDLENERVMMMKFNFPSIIEYKTVFYYNMRNPTSMRSYLLDNTAYTHYCVLFDFPGKELKQVNSQIKQYNEDRVLEIFSQILLAVKYLHDMNIVHGDLNLKVSFNLIDSIFRITYLFQQK